MANIQERRDKITKAKMLKVQTEYQVDLHQNLKDNNPADIRDFSNRIIKAKDVTLAGGPFHYNIRAATYGDPYDEIPWKVRMGMSATKERHGYPENPLINSYAGPVLMHNWVEDRRDKNFIKYNNGSRLASYGHHYQSEVMRSYRNLKPLCNKQRDVLLKIANFPMSPYPGHQPELNPLIIQLSAPASPPVCSEQAKLEDCQKEMRRQKALYNASQ